MEKVQAKFRALYRYLLFTLILIRYLVRGSLIFRRLSDPVERRKACVRLGQETISYCAKKFGLIVTVKNQPPQNEVCLMVGNHLGFLDILAVGSLFPTSFVTSREMYETPVLGTLTELAGCLYVERRKRANIANELKEIGDEMRKGFRVILYPEATSTNGEQVLPFKKTLIMSAAYANCPIRPFVFNFKRVAGGPVEFKHRDHLCWYGDQSFVGALWRAFELKSVEVEIEFFAPLYPQVDDDRGVIANKLHDVISANYIPFKNPYRGLEALNQLNEARR